MKTFSITYLAVVLLLFSNSKLTAQTRLLKTVLPVSKEKLYQNLKSVAYQGEVALFEFEPDISSKKTISVELEGRPVEFTLKELDMRGDGNFTWYGGNQRESGSIVLVQMAGHLAGNIFYDLKSYTISPYGRGRAALYVASEEGLPLFADPSAPMAVTGMPKQKALRLSAESDSVVTIRILFAYTQDIETRVSNMGYPDMKLFLQASIGNANATYINSNVTHRIQFVCGVKVSFPGEGIGYAQPILAKFSGVSDGNMDEIHDYRNFYSADVCVLVTKDLVDPERGGLCGIATAVGSTDSSAFCAVAWGCMLSSTNTLAHEIGHLNWCRHNVEEDANTTPAPYAHGYRNPTKGWRTVMAYRCEDPLPSCPSIPYFSNPNVSYLGDPTGTATTHDNARVLNENSASLAGYRSAPIDLILTDSASLSDDEFGQAIATSEILLTSGFEVTDSSYFDALVSPSAGNIDYAPFRKALTITVATIDGIEKGDFNVYPNPTNGHFSIKRANGKSGPIKLSVINITGKQVISAASQMNDLVDVNISGNPPGVYILRINEGDTVFTRKILLSE